MTTEKPAHFQDLEQCVEALLGQVGKKVVIGGGFGRPIHIFNELFRRASEDPGIDLTIITGLSMNKPRASSDLEKRFMDPFVERVFGNLPDLDYIPPYIKQQLPKNIEVVEIFLAAGAYLNNPTAQQNYVYSNFTHWFRDMIDLGLNVFGQQISTRVIDGELAYSMSGDAYALDVLPRMQSLREQGNKVAVVGQVNRELPFMYNDAVVSPQAYDLILEHPRYDHTLLGPPTQPIDTADYLIGLNASALIPDGGTLQIGIGSLGDAIAYGLIQRQEHNERYRDALSRLGTLDNHGELIERVGDTAPFEVGLYGSTEMFADGFRHLYDHGVLKREVYGDAALQKLVNDGKIGRQVTPAALDHLVEAGAINARLGERDVSYLRTFGIFDSGVTLADGVLRSADGVEMNADLSDAASAALIHQHCLGRKLAGGVVLHGGFFLGPQAMYQALRTMPEDEARKICMTDIGYVNQLYTCEELARLQRQKARFMNTTIMVSLLGAACSDGLEDGRKVSGVGGQYNFVAMGQALDDARSVLMCRSTRTKNDKVSSNIVWNYGHTTIPAHLRDIVVTEYGIADLRGKREKDVITGLLNITDSRFQEELLSRAKSAGKVPGDYRIPDRFRNNTPERLADIGRNLKAQGMLPQFPFGTDFTREELALAGVLKSLKTKMSSKAAMFKSLASAVEVSMAGTDEARPYLARMGLDNPQTLKDRAIQKLIIAELRDAGHITL